MNFLKVKVEKFSKELEEVEYVDKSLPGEIGSTKYLYFKKITISNLLGEQSKQIFDIKVKIGIAFSEYKLKHSIQVSEEEAEKFKRKMEEHKQKRKKMTEEQKEEEDIENAFDTSAAYREIGVNSYDIIKMFKDIQEKFMFLDPQGKIPFNKDAQEQFGFEIVEVYFFLLVLSI